MSEELKAGNIEDSEFVILPDGRLASTRYRPAPGQQAEHTITVKVTGTKKETAAMDDDQTVPLYPDREGWRRVMILTVDADRIGDVLEGRVRLAKGVLPEDAKPYGVQYRLEANAFDVAFQSATFEPVPPCMMAKRMMPEWELVETEDEENLRP